MGFWHRIRGHVTSWAFLVPFLAFALFPFYWAIITSFKADANLYDLRRNPFWFAKTDAVTHQPYHKDIIVPASYPAAPIHWEIKQGDHTTRSDSEANPKPIARIGRSEEHTSELQS